MTRLTTDPMPEPDGAPFRCSVLFYPYDAEDRCPKAGTTRLTTASQLLIGESETVYRVRHPKHIAPKFTGPIVCAVHLKFAESFVSECGVEVPDPLG
jgi:hypothetical protein